MTHSITSRVVPEAGAVESPSQQPAYGDEDGMVNIISNGRCQCSFPAAAKAWVSDAVPPGSSDDLSAPATAVHYYRQRRDFDNDHGTPALLAWLTGLLCMPRLGSGRMRAPAASRSDSVDSVDFVSTWQRAQAEAAARRVVPVLKRANAAEFTPPVPNTPEWAPRAEAETASEVELTVCSMTIPPVEVESKSGRSISFVAPVQRPSSSQVAPSCVSSADLMPFLLDNLPQGAANSRPGSRADSHQGGKRSVRFN